MILAVLEKGPVSGLAQRRFPQHNWRHKCWWSCYRSGRSCSHFIFNEDTPVDKGFVLLEKFVWEIRPVNRVDQRIQEAEKLGFSTILYPNTIKSPENTGIKINW
jgi:hypothetical protein